MTGPYFVVQKQQTATTQPSFHVCYPVAILKQKHIMSALLLVTLAANYMWRQLTPFKIKQARLMDFQSLIELSLRARH